MGKYVNNERTVRALEKWGREGDEKLERLICESLTTVERMVITYRYKVGSFCVTGRGKDGERKKMTYKEISKRLRAEAGICITANGASTAHYRGVNRLRGYLEETGAGELTGEDKLRHRFVFWGKFGDEEIDGFVNGLGEEDRKIITLRFKKGMSWAGAAMKVYMSERHIYRKFNKIVENLQKYLEENKEDKREAG